MTVLVLGGAASGKSELAEEIAVKLGGPRVYVATMEPYGDEGVRRVARHRALRAAKGFCTVECYRGLEHASFPAGGTALLECVTNLLANEMFSPHGAGSGAESAILRGIEGLKERMDNVVVVTGDVFRDGTVYTEGTAAYLLSLAAVNGKIAASFDVVIEAVCGLPVRLKGELP